MYNKRFWHYNYKMFFFYFPEDSVNPQPPSRHRLPILRDVAEPAASTCRWAAREAAGSTSTTSTTTTSSAAARRHSSPGRPRRSPFYPCPWDPAGDRRPPTWTTAVAGATVTSTEDMRHGPRSPGTGATRLRRNPINVENNRTVVVVVLRRTYCK